jgi:hypothetical protein
MHVTPTGKQGKVFGMGLTFLTTLTHTWLPILMDIEKVSFIMAECAKILLAH